MNDKSPPEIPNVDRMIEYCTGIADEFLARLNRIRAFIPDHNLTSGTANETMLRNFLAEFSSGSFAVGQGFICDPTISPEVTEHTISKQTDILIYNRDYPIVHSEGEVKVVWPQSVRMLIEVKTKLNKKGLIEALNNIYIAKQVPYMNLVPGLIFAFKSSSVETVIKHLREYPKMLPASQSPSVILLLDKAVIIHRWSPLDAETSLYEVRKGHAGNKAVVIAFLVMFFFNIVMSGAWGGASITNMLRRMLEHRTERILENFEIGERN
jgi:hypothetical protein